MVGLNGEQTKKPIEPEIPVNAGFSLECTAVSLVVEPPIQAIRIGDHVTA